MPALRDAFANAFLERQAFEEHFQSDVLLGDLVWETSYGLPGEGTPPRVVAHVTFSWPSWSQALYRSWYVEGVMLERPAIAREEERRVVIDRGEEEQRRVESRREGVEARPLRRRHPAQRFAHQQPARPSRRANQSARAQSPPQNRRL